MANGKFISLQVAGAMTAAYRATINEEDTTAQRYDGDLVKQILDQEGCDGIRTYFGIEDGQNVVVIVGVDADGNDLHEGLILENGAKCPPNCSSENDLNS